jgi:oxygen-dependent protoporphyrinogen oxidase
LVGGIYTADPQLLSAEATMPRFRQMERDYGSLLRAMWHERRIQPSRNEPTTSGARYSKFATLRGGMSQLVSRLAECLPQDCVQLNAPVESLWPMNEGRWLLWIGGENPRQVHVDGVVLAVPANQSARLLAPVDEALAGELREIEYASCAVVSLGYRREQIKHPLDGFGFVVPFGERRTILSCSYSSIKYEGRAPEGTVLLRIFIGGACQSGLLQLSRQHLMELAELEVADLLQIRGEPILRTAIRQRQAMPQYHVGHRDRVARIETRLERFPTLRFAGSALDGVGVPACIQSGEAAAMRLLSQAAVACPC